MAQKMFRKVIVSGNIVEVYEYEKPVKFDFKKKKKEELPEVENDMSIHMDWEDHPNIEEIPEEIRHLFDKENRGKEYRKSAMMRARQTLRRLILSNFNEDSKFITLTFRDGETEDIKDVRQTNPLFNKFIKRLNYQLKKKGKDPVKYATVVEFQDKNKRGAVHYHMMCNLGWMPHKELTKIWKHGWVGINSLKGKHRKDGKSVDNVGAYMIKYMLKDFNDDRLRGQKSYFTSRNLIKPEVYKGMEAEALSHIIELDKMKEVFTSEYESEYHGKVQYREYNLKRCTTNTAE